MYPSHYIRFATPELERQWNEGYRDDQGNLCQLHPALRIIILAAAYKHFCLTKGKPLVITSLYRPGRGSVHNDGRGGDCRTHNIPNPQRKWWLRWLNETFIYHGKPGCKTAMIHDTEQGLHLHSQIGSKELTPEMPESYIQA